MPASSSGSSLPLTPNPADRESAHVLSRRGVLRGGLGTLAALGAAGLSLGSGEAMAAAVAQAAPTRPIAGTSLKILTWKHIVNEVDAWLQGFVSQWGQQNEVATSIEFVDSATIPHALETELAQGAGHDLIEHIAPLQMYASSLADLSDVQQEAVNRHGAQLAFCQLDGLDMVTGRTYGFVHGYSPLAVFYRQTMWEAIQMASGPRSWSDLAIGSQAIWATKGIPLAFGLSDDLDSTNAILSALWAQGGTVVDQSGEIALDSAATVAVVEMFRELYTTCMLPNVLTWTIQSNNDAMFNDLAPAILNPLSAFRYTLQHRHDAGLDIRVRRPLTGDLALDVGRQPMTPAGVRFVSMVPSYSPNQDTAREFLLALVGVYDQLHVASKTYNFPAFPSTVPLLKQDGGLLDNDPLYPDQGRRLSVLKDANEWTANLGWPGPTTPVVAAMARDGMLGKMVRSAALGQMSAQDAVRETSSQLEALRRTLG